MNGSFDFCRFRRRETGKNRTLSVGVRRSSIVRELRIPKY